MSDNIPRLFVSYSWTTPDHEAWVLQLATELRENGVDVVLDKWELREGHDAYAFMEKMVSDPTITKVILVCDKQYAEKADGRAGGVGVETQIITPGIYAKADQDKFVAIVADRDETGKAYLPAYYKSRIYIDLADPSRYAENFEQLIRWAHNKPVHQKPEIGSPPAFLTEESAITLGTSAAFKRAIDAVRNGREVWQGAVEEYLSILAESMERFRMVAAQGEKDDQFIQNIEAFLPYRNQVIELFIALAQYQNNEQASQLTHRFFEKLLPYLDRPERMTSWREDEFDNFRFVVHELLLYAVAILLRQERFSVLGSLLRTGFYYPNENSATNGMVSFNCISHHIRLLEFRNQRLKSNRISLQADILKDRSQSSGLRFLDLMQADFFLYLYDALDSLSNTDGWQRWNPITLVFTERQNKCFEVFARSQSRVYFEQLCNALNINSKARIDELVQAYTNQKARRPYWDHFHFVNVEGVMGYDKLATRP